MLSVLEILTWHPDSRYEVCCRINAYINKKDGDFPESINLGNVTLVHDNAAVCDSNSAIYTAFINNIRKKKLTYVPLSLQTGLLDP